MALNLSLSADDIRTLFSDAMSQMYQQEVPQYATLVQLVEDINQETLRTQHALAQQLSQSNEQARLHLERHGAIRVGSAEELNMLGRVFALMGMYPVGYYDLSSAGVPVHSTAFRPIDDASLQKNPFRIFTSLLRLDLIEDPDLRQQASTLLDKRDIFTAKARLLLSQAEAMGRLNTAQAHQFVSEILETFRWQQHANVSLETYQALNKVHPLIADVVCFNGPHINHLTPRALDIDAVQQKMPTYGITSKATVEGPPRRRCPILLRQTSFKALEEPVLFIGEDTKNAHTEAGTHSARFGEVEQRGMALTPKGRALYDELLNRARHTLAATEHNNQQYQQQLVDIFSEFPDDEQSLRSQQLGYFRYQVTQEGLEKTGAISVTDSLESLIEQGWVSGMPIIYEDFLPVSAAGIFQSNLGDSLQSVYHKSADQASFEQALGCPVLDEFELYAKQQQDSIDEVYRILGDNH
ncbi:2-oxoadipate dioxygenase/decarboxylase HglS [Oceanisphaera pacifica]|uniref:2-oxoadipate dioxygenase/decarboxylase n=1 Tax=Oceanisphaera pacifica TaxID=2818389 RepID=A0ABS3NFQ3_9GAMM|nr:VOC family protein [Oceanisphaera pacifica]MBO1519413.1 VOC family protein [Oceanisphaera pacifica]